VLFGVRAHTLSPLAVWGPRVTSKPSCDESVAPPLHFHVASRFAGFYVPLS